MTISSSARSRHSSRLPRIRWNSVIAQSTGNTGGGSRARDRAARARANVCSMLRCRPPRCRAQGRALRHPQRELLLRARGSGRHGVDHRRGRARRATALRGSRRCASRAAQRARSTARWRRNRARSRTASASSAASAGVSVPWCATSACATLPRERRTARRLQRSVEHVLIEHVREPIPHRERPVRQLVGAHRLHQPWISSSAASRSSTSAGSIASTSLTIAVSNSWPCTLATVSRRDPALEPIDLARRSCPCTVSGSSRATSAVVVRQVPPPAVPHDFAAVAQVAHQVHHEERVALRLLVDQRDERGRERVARELERQIALDVGRDRGTRADTRRTRWPPAAAARPAGTGGARRPCPMADT